MIVMNFSIERLLIPPEIHTYVFELNIMVPYLLSPRFWKWDLVLFYHNSQSFKYLYCFFFLHFKILLALLVFTFQGATFDRNCICFFPAHVCDLQYKQQSHKPHCRCFQLKLAPRTCLRYEWKVNFHMGGSSL